MRVANRTKDYTQIDALIKEHIPKFLYNNGEGKLVEKQREKISYSNEFVQITISEIVRRRNNTFSKVKNIIPTGKSPEEEQTNGELKISLE